MTPSTNTTMGAAFSAAGFKTITARLDELTEKAITEAGGNATNAAALLNKFLANDGALLRALIAEHIDVALAAQVRRVALKHDEFRRKPAEGRYPPEPRRVGALRTPSGAEPGEKGGAKAATTTRAVLPRPSLPARGPEAIRQTAAVVARSLLDHRDSDLGKAIGDMTKAELAALKTRNAFRARLYALLAERMPDAGTVRQYISPDEANEIEQKARAQ